MTKLRDPYAGLPVTTRYQSRISVDDYAYLRNLLVAGTGSVQTIINHMVAHLINTAKNRGIYDYTQRDQFVELLTGTYPLTGLPSNPPVGEDIKRPKRGGTPRRRSGTKGNPTEPANAQGASPEDRP